MGYLRTTTYGGTDGHDFSDDLTTVKRIKKITIKAADFVDSIQVEWETETGEEKIGTKHGGEGGEMHVVELASGEVITKITGKCEDYIDQITFHTNKRKKYGPFGGEGGQPFDMEVTELVGFFGKAGDFLDQIGCYETPGKPGTTTKPTTTKTVTKTVAKTPAKAPITKTPTKAVTDKPAPKTTRTKAAPKAVELTAEETTVKAQARPRARA